MPVITPSLTSIARLLWTWAAMLMLLAVIAASPYLRLGGYEPWVQLTCVVLIVAMLACWWMNLAYSSAAVRIAAVAAIFFLIIMVSLSFNDYLTRRTSLAPYQPPPALPAPR